MIWSSAFVPFEALLSICVGSKEATMGIFHVPIRNHCWHFGMSRLLSCFLTASIVLSLPSLDSPSLMCQLLRCRLSTDQFTYGLSSLINASAEAFTTLLCLGCHKKGCLDTTGDVLLSAVQPPEHFLWERWPDAPTTIIPTSPIMTCITRFVFSQHKKIGPFL